jgi:hypothetical protein
LRDFLAGIDARKLALGIVDEPADVEAMRNRGAHRTEAKRELLRRAEQRATQAGLKPTIISHY